MAPQLRHCCSRGEETLIALAAQQWQVEPSAVRIVDARFVNHDSTKSLTISDLARGLKLVKTIPGDVKTTPAKEWTIAGQSTPKVDGRDFVTGRHKYTSDVSRDGMFVWQGRSTVSVQRHTGVV
jgi:isoquinoline 1-oxidoreductase